MKPPARVPRATYRVQLHAGFTFEQLAEIIPYLHDLGISDIYASPFFLATPGSTHGYDVCDPNAINPEIGGMEGLRKVSSLLQERDMGLLVDFVPNHMGVEGPDNWRWMDVLENGHLSRFAPFFDIEWNPRQVSLQDRILVPMLHDFYGRVLDSGGIKLKYDNAAFHVDYGSLRFPLRPESYGTILRRLAWFKNPGDAVSQQTEKLAQQFGSLPKPAVSESAEQTQDRNRQRDALRQDLATLIETERLHADLDKVLEALNGKPGNSETFDNLHQILEEQNYRLAYWKTGTHEINYRRFFAIDTLVGLHMESQAVFEECHQLLRSLIEQGIVTGVRVDHIDGLWDPAQYLERLAQLAPNGEKPFYSLVEKILTEKENLPENWATHGTTGYDFAGSLINLLIVAPSENEFTRIYCEFAGITLSPDEQAYRLKLHIMEELFPNAVDNLALDLEAHVKSDRRWRDWTVSDLRPAISRIVACLSVYRTYRTAGQPPTATDIEVVEKAVAEALRLNLSADPSPFYFIRDLWTGSYPDEKAGPELKAWADAWISNLQQYTGAIMAKSVEDTFFYRYVRLFAANEVGHHPSEFGRPPGEFHEGNIKRLRHWPASMLATSTHDTKMSEDVRARLLALSEIPERWDAAIHRWSKLNHLAKMLVNDRLAPDANEEYLLYQILLGAWPLGEEEVNETFVERIKQYMRKALSEAKAHTNWANPDELWLKACDQFIEKILDRALSGPFWEDFLPFTLDIALRGRNLSLVQVALKLTAPGVPDFYQGTELWDFSLVDPDNRRPVDYACRQESLKALGKVPFSELFVSWKDGRAKMALIRALLDYRSKQKELFLCGDYAPVAITGADASRIIAFSRRGKEEQILVVAVRSLGIELGHSLQPSDDTTLLSPSGAPVWHDLLSNGAIKGEDRLSVRELLNGLPIGIYRAVTTH
jgi:(1->4)-alpha-D-glucan 1-alpha-D-glucosylmutase